MIYVAPTWFFLFINLVCNTLDPGCMYSNKKTNMYSDSIANLVLKFIQMMYISLAMMLMVLAGGSLVIVKFTFLLQEKIMHNKCPTDGINIEGLARSPMYNFLTWKQYITIL